MGMLSSTRDIAPSCVENVDELIERQEKSLSQLDSKRNVVTDLIAKGKVILQNPDRMRKVLENRAVQDEERMSKLEEELKDARNKAEDADKQYDEVAKRLQQVESELERAEERAETGEMKIIELEEELRVVANNLKSLEVSEEKANQ